MGSSLPKRSTMPTVDLVFDDDCPHIDDARALLQTALAQAGLPTQWREWHRDASETPKALRGLGSPTIFVNGLDVSGAEETGRQLVHANSCRVYPSGGRLRGVPALSTLVIALSRPGTR
jgi:mercuric ion transport protein